METLDSPTEEPPRQTGKDWELGKFGRLVHIFGYTMCISFLWCFIFCMDFPVILIFLGKGWSTDILWKRLSTLTMKHRCPIQTEDYIISFIF